MLSFIYVSIPMAVAVISSIIGLKSIMYIIPQPISTNLSSSYTDLHLKRCIDDVTPATQSDAGCGAEGAFIQYFIYVGGTSWICTGINLFFVVVVEIRAEIAL